MLEPDSCAPQGEEWDEQDWERFLQLSDARAAKFQELYETLADHPERDVLIAREMGWEERLAACTGSDDCPGCDQRFECEAYELSRLMADPKSIEEDPDTAELTACFEQLRAIPAYQRAQDFANHLEGFLRRRLVAHIADEDVRNALFTAQMVSAQIAGGHGIGYDRECLCGNIANCKRAARSLGACVQHLRQLHRRHMLTRDEILSLSADAVELTHEIDRWIDALRDKRWWC